VSSRRAAPPARPTCPMEEVRTGGQKVPGEESGGVFCQPGWKPGDLAASRSCRHGAERFGAAPIESARRQLNRHRLDSIGVKTGPSGVTPNSTAWSQTIRHGAESNGLNTGLSGVVPKRLAWRRTVRRDAEAIGVTPDRSA
ncbi:MAG TPA: hypothetical protein VOA87_01850, partial [Thermoanaerobaculia bacterium]|nr:hypothetical protein [Thermoanaerobaculia bacterium]